MFSENWSTPFRSQSSSNESSTLGDLVEVYTRLREAMPFVVAPGGSGDDEDSLAFLPGDNTQRRFMLDHRAELVAAGIAVIDPSSLGP
jgi:hypothetical protein